MTRFTIGELRFTTRALHLAIEPVFGMTKEEMKDRTKRYALRAIKVAKSIPNDRVGNVIGSQLLRAATSVGANYRAVCRAKSTADFVNKLKIVEEECDESLFWMELLIESETQTQQKMGALMAEGNEILSIVVAALKTTRQSQSS